MAECMGLDAYNKIPPCECGWCVHVREIGDIWKAKARAEGRREVFDRVINYLDAGIVLFKGQGVATESLIEIYRSIRDDVRKEASRMEAERQGGEAARAGGEEEE